jgi:hypothetical protein
MLSSRKTHNLRRLTTVVQAKELEQPPLVALGFPVIAKFRRICNDVVQEVLQLHQSNLVPLLSYV